jgi:hypothetical protein
MWDEKEAAEDKQVENSSAHTAHLSAESRWTMQSPRLALLLKPIE